MARMDESILKNLRGALGKQLVVKQYGDKTVVTKYPHMRKVKPSELQKLYRARFTEAVAYAKAISRHPLQKAAYQHKVKNGQSVYHYALKEYLEKNKWK
jgi:hypothetical protein